jgi:DNA polymerase-3 subunit delta
VCIAFGDEAFLKRLVLKQLRGEAVGEEEASVTRLEGEKAQWRELADGLASFSLFGGGGRRLVIVENADDFVSAHRGELEDLAAEPVRSGILLLDVKTHASNTKLYKAVEAGGLQVECKLPEKAAGKKKVLDEDRLIRWLGQWAEQQHQVKLPQNAANVLVELVGNELGLLDQSLAKLALFVKPNEAVTADLVREVVGGWQAKDIWELLETAADGNAGLALKYLGKLIDGGEKPIALFGQIAWSFRRFNAALRIVERAERSGQRVDLSAALAQAGFRQWPREALTRAEQQLKQLGRPRIATLYRQLLDLDLALKGTHSRDDRARFLLEQFFLSLSREADPRR